MQEDAGCLAHLRESLALCQRIGDRRAEAVAAHSLGNAYLLVSVLLDLDEAEHWFQYSLRLRDESDRLGRADCHAQLSGLALTRFDAALNAGEAERELLEHLNTALRNNQQAQDLYASDDHERRGAVENQFGVIYRRVGDTRQALRHYQLAIQHEEARGSVFGAALTRYNIAILLLLDGRIGDALPYARAALDGYEQAGPGAADHVSRARRLISELENRDDAG
jgi:tetratricopeptide (TPR) repeat protein